MRDLFRSKVYFWNSYLPIAFALFLLSFLKAAYGQEAAGSAYVRAADWKTVCLGRFLVDLPPSAELGATGLKYQGTYGFEGLNTGNAWGTLRYGDIKISETIQAKKSDFEKMRLIAKTKAGNPEIYAKLIKAREKDVAYITKMAKDSPEEADNYKKILQDRKNSLDEAIFNSKATGEAKLDDPNGFAVRLGSSYSLGIFDIKDQRIRMFASEKITSKNDSAEGAAEEYQRMRERYHTRLPTNIPEGPGFCTYYGFIDEPHQAEANVTMRVPIQIKQYPNLVLALEIEPSSLKGPRDIQKFPDMDTAHNALDKIGVKRTHGPKAVQILGTPGRSYAQEYGDNCSSTSCRPASQAYDMEARTFGDPDRLDRPRLMLHMTAALSDDYKLKLPAVPEGNNVPDRPALRGHVPPPYDVGKEIFEQVLRSIRPRPGAIVAQGRSAASSAVEQQK